MAFHGMAGGFVAAPDECHDTASSYWKVMSFLLLRIRCSQNIQSFRVYNVIY